MKNLVYLATIIISLLLTTSCVDLTQEPQSFLTEEDYIASMNLDGFQKAATALYKNLWYHNYGFNCHMQCISVCADDITYSPTKAGNPLANYGALTPNLSVNNADFNMLWPNFYTVINNANKLINNVTIPNDATQEEKYKQVLGEVYFMRGLCYFYLVRIFGDIPLILKGEDASIQMLRTSVEEIYNQAIIPSLTTAAEWLPETSRSGFSSTPSKWAAKACLADVYMTMAGWPLKKGVEFYSKAATITKEIIQNSGLELTVSYSDLWKEALKQEANEHIFALHHSVVDKVASNYGKAYYPKDFYPNAGWAEYYSSENFYLIYPNDDRKTWNFMTEWEAGTKTNHKLVNYTESVDGLPAISKYFDYDEGAPGQSAQSNGITCIYRYADVLLMYAEASTRATGNVDALALQSLNAVQERANSPIITTSVSVTEFEKAVFNERGWEFFAEMKRWFDLVRLEKVAEVKTTEWTTSTFKANNHYYMPIPYTQIELTGWTNNAGY
jgi:hypothetical protein